MRHEGSVFVDPQMGLVSSGQYFKRPRDGLFDGESFRGWRLVVWMEMEVGGFRHTVVRCSVEREVQLSLLPQAVNDGEIRRIDHKQVPHRV